MRRAQARLHNTWADRGEHVSLDELTSRLLLWFSRATGIRPQQLQYLLVRRADLDRDRCPDAFGPPARCASGPRTRTKASSMRRCAVTASR